MPIVSACKKDALEEKRGLAVNCAGQDIALFLIDGKYFACSNRCPHAGAQLCDGFIDGTVVTCPWHGWSFELNASGTEPRDGVTRYEVIDEDGELKVVIPD